MTHPPEDESPDANDNKRIVSRRKFIARTVVGGAVVAGAGKLILDAIHPHTGSAAFIAKAGDYSLDFKSIIADGLKQLGFDASLLKDKRILLKPNLVETNPGVIHINTHPHVVRGAIEAFLSFGAGEVIVAEGPGHCRDSFRVLTESGMASILKEDRIRFIDLNYDAVFHMPNHSKFTKLPALTLPESLRQVDLVVSMPKLKTHHWVGVTLAMKNLFGIMPGSYYGWPKNVLHFQGIDRMILDITATVRPGLAIVDGVTGMEGDGPIMGNPKDAGVIVMGTDLPAVDATCARIMTIDPERIPYLNRAGNWIGGIKEDNIRMLGETIQSVQTRFDLLDKIPSQQGIRLG